MSSMDWSVFWTAVGGIAQAAAAIATFLAVGVALWLGIREGRRSLQARYDDARPVLQTVSDQANIPVEQGNELYLDWNKPQFSIRVDNVGSGPAFNISSVIYGPEAIAVPNQLTSPGASWKHLSDKKENHWYHWTTDAVNQGEKKMLLSVLASPHNHPLRTNRFPEVNKHIESRDHKQKYVFNAPEHPLSQSTP